MSVYLLEIIGNSTSYIELIVSLLGGGTLLGIYQAHRNYQLKKEDSKAKGGVISKNEIELLKVKLLESDTIINELKTEILTLSVQRQEYETALRLLTDYIKDE